MEVAEPRPNRRLRDLMTETGCSNKGLARRMRDASASDGGELVSTTHTTIAKYLSGAIAQPSERGCSVLVAVMSELTGRTLSSADVGYPQRLATPPDNRAVDIDFESPVVIASRLQRIAESNVEDGVLDIIDIALDDVVRRYEAEGPKRLAPEVFALRKRVDTLVHQRQHPLQLHRLYVFAAKLSGTLGYMAVNRGRFGAARMYCRESYEIASLIEDPSLKGWVKGTESFCSYYMGDFQSAAKLAREGISIAGSDPQSIRLYSNGLARALGKLGDPAGVQEAIDAASVIATGQPDGLTPALTFAPYSVARLAANAATAWLSAGRYAEALDCGYAVEDLVNESDSMWSRALVRIDMATALVRSSSPEIEQAMAFGQEALAISEDRPIRSVWQRARELGAAVRAVNIPEVREYAAALHEWSSRAKPFAAPESS